jgi:hypothetical protein
MTLPLKLVCEHLAKANVIAITVRSFLRQTKLKNAKKKKAFLVTQLASDGLFMNSLKIPKG